MASNFPTGLDVLNNPTSSDFLDTVGVLHDFQHANANDAIEALQAKVGINGSLVTTTLDYKITNHLAAADPHTQYQKESERNAASGYAGLDGSSLLAVAQIPNLPESRITNLTTDLSTINASVASLSGSIAGLAVDSTVVHNSLYDPNTILKADSDNTPGALTVGASTILGRGAAGSIAALTAAQTKTILATVSGDISDFSEAVDDRLNALLIAGTGIILTYDDPSNTLTIASTVASTITTATVATSENSLSGTYGDLATVGPSVNVTIGPSGRALVTVTAFTGNNTSGGEGFMDFTVSGTSTRAASDTTALRYVSSTGASSNARLSVTNLISGLTPGAGNVFTAKYKRSSNTQSFVDRNIIVTPLG